MTTAPTRVYSRVLVLLDGSEAAEFAIRFAVDMARRHHAELILLYLDHLAARTAGGEADTPTRVQNLIETLYKFIDTERVSLIVMSTQGKTGMGRWLFGGSVENALSDIPVPLMLVRPKYGKIALPLDGSRWSEGAIPRAAAIARLHQVYARAGTQARPYILTRISCFYRLPHISTGRGILATDRFFAKEALDQWLDLTV